MSLHESEMQAVCEIASILKYCSLFLSAPVFQELEQYKRNAAKSWKGLALET